MMGSVLQALCEVKVSGSWEPRQYLLPFPAFVFGQVRLSHHREMKMSVDIEGFDE